jgi:hypothetical protein
MRFRGVFNHPVALSTFALLLVALAVAASGDVRPRILDLLVAVPLIALSDTRSGLIGLGLIAILAGGHRALKRRGRDVPRTLIVGLPLALFVSQLVLSWWAAHRAQELAKTTSWRSVIWNWCWTSVQSRPYQGNDTGVFAGGPRASVLWWHCHNETLTTLYSLGVAGMAALALVVAVFTILAYRQMRGGNALPWLVLVAFAWLGNVETPLGFQADLQSVALVMVFVLLIVNGGRATTARIQRQAAWGR